jgi:hypothetical protein
MKLARQRRCKTCRKTFRAERRTTCSEECQLELSKAIAARQKESHKRMAERTRNVKAGGVNHKPRTIHEALTMQGHDEDFEPTPCAAFCATDAPAGSPEKVEVLRRRVELGQPLWHQDDRLDYAGLTGAVHPIDRTPRRVSERNATRVMYPNGRKGLAQ